MHLFEVKRYTDNDKQEWDRFVSGAKNATFLFYRDYMDYHRDRFTDYSLMIYRKGRLLALLPANVVGDVLWSHQGLTYGGLLTNVKVTVTEVMEVFKAVNAFLQNANFHKVVYKAIPWIYHRIPAEEDLYALTNVCDAHLTVRHVSSTLVGGHRLKFAESRKSGLRKALRQGLLVKQSDDLEAFWTILTDNLSQRFGAKPVHSLQEMELLKSRFPNQIKLFMTYQGETPLGGTLIYETPQVVHTQYISASPEGKREGALDLLFDYVLNKVYADVPYFDFGKSSNGDGHELNQTLIFQKEGFGGRAVCYDWYQWNI